MALQVQAASSLSCSELPWAAEAELVASCAFLESRGLHKSGPWRRECACGQAGPYGLLPVQKESQSAAWGLPLGASRCISQLRAPFGSWASYYTARGLPLSSPAALWLDAALTLVHALSMSGVIAASEGGALTVTVHLLGARKELDQLDAFQEAAALLPCALRLVLLGPDVPASLHGEARHAGNSLSVSFLRCASYAAALQDGLQPPHLVFAPNAGVPAYPELWKPTAEALARSQTPLVVTDHTEEAALTTQRLLTGAGLRLTMPVQLNPWRRPVSSAGRSSALPSFSNGWLAGFA